MAVTRFGFGKREPLLLLLGDILLFIVSLWLALFLRNWSAPSGETLRLHLLPFTFLFVIWVAIFYIAGLYGKHTTLLRSKLPSTLLNTLVVNAVLAVLFFYLIPSSGITPKIVLFIYIAVSAVLVIVWRMYVYFLLAESKTENAIIIGSGVEMAALIEEVNSNDIYGIHFVSSGDLAESRSVNFVQDLVEEVKTKNVSMIVLDMGSPLLEPILPHLYELLFTKVAFLDMNEVYEETFDRIPLSLLKYNWFLANVSTRPRAIYDATKRLIDIVLSLVLGLISLIFYPFVALAIKLDDGGKVFLYQERVGQGGKMVRIHKFRSMHKSDNGEYGNGVENSITRVGGFLRKSRIDELPQLWDVFLGRVSLIGPRPELPALVETYEHEIPYYNVRHILIPGLSGWAQIHQENHPHHKEAIAETKEKLTYDLYYIKNRSVLLDLQIALKTLKTLLSRAGR